MAGGEVCPLDENYLADEEKWIRQCAATGVDIIQFDDDFNVNIGFLMGFGCCCENHMKKYCEILGENVSKEEFTDKIFKGGANKYRDAWLQGNRETLLAFAKRMRKVVDSVNPNIRMGHCSVMSTYDIDGVDSFELARAFAGNAGIAFGENVKLLGEEELNSGLILDIPAALKLKARGIDVGLLHAEKKQPSVKEYFAETGELCGRWGASGEYAIQVADRAIVTSYYGGISDHSYPACYRYENAEGQRFVVFAFDGYCANEVQYRCYERQRQLVSDINWLTGRKPDAVCLGNPDLYMVTKKSEKELSVGLFNMFIDSMLDPVVALAEEAEEVEFINCAGSFEGDRIHLSDIPPYSFAALRITLK